MDFDIVSALIGLVVGVAGSAAVGRAKFSVVQEELRQARDYAQRMGDLAAERGRELLNKPTVKGISRKKKA